MKTITIYTAEVSCPEVDGGEHREESPWNVDLTMYADVEVSHG